MKLVADRKELLAALKSVSKFLPRRLDGMPHANILFEAQGPTLKLTATDLEAGRTLTVPTKAAEPGRALVSQDVAGVLAGASGDDVSLHTTTKSMVVQSKDSIWQLALHPAEDYPDLTSRSDSDSAKVDIAHWSRVRAVAEVAAGANQRAALLGVFLADGVAVATDSYRMAWAEFTEPDEHPSTLAPASAIRSLEAGVTALEVGDRMIRADTDDGSWWTRVIDDTYINWQNLLKQFTTPTVIIEAETEPLDEAIRRATILGVRDLPIWVEAQPDEPVRLSRVVQGEIVYEESVPVKVTGDEDVKIAFNPAFLRSMIAPVSKVRVEIADQYKMCRIIGDDWWNGALMPVRT